MDQVVGVVELVRVVMVDEEVVEGMELVGLYFEAGLPAAQVVVTPEQLHQLHLDQHGHVSGVLCNHCMSGMFDHSQ